MLSVLTEGIKIIDDSITYVPSGLIESKQRSCTFTLTQTIKPVNQLRMIEDSVVIYRISSHQKEEYFILM